MCIIASRICEIVFLKTMYKQENKKRAGIVANWEESDFAAEAMPMLKKGDQKHSKMYRT